MKNLKIVLAVLIVLLVGLYGYMGLKQRGIEGEKTITGAQPSFAFVVDDLGFDQYARPHQRVWLQIGGLTSSKKLVGEYAMDCTIASGNQSLPSGTVLVKRCWWGGAGKELAVTVQGTSYAVKEKDLDEQTGEGEYKTLFEIK